MIGMTISTLKNMNNNLPIITNTLTPNVRVFFSQRGEVIPNDDYSSFNICNYTGDSEEHILYCRNRLCDYLNIPLSNLITPRQTHSLNVKIIDSTTINSSELENVDALVTNLNDVGIAVNTADCVPVLLADDTAGVIAAIHSGWKGTVGKISAKAVECMLSLGATPHAIKAFIGVSICPECFEVGDEVVEQFSIAFPHVPEIIINSQPRCHINLQQACRQTLIDCGLHPENIILSNICSRCNPKTYFSARRMGINSGRTLSGIIISK